MSNMSRRPSLSLVSLLFVLQIKRFILYVHLQEKILQTNFMMLTASKSNVHLNIQRLYVIKETCIKYDKDFIVLIIITD